MEANNFKEVHVAVSRMDAGVSVLSIIEVAPVGRFSPDAAKVAGFDEVDGLYIREVTDGVIEQELTRTILAGGVSLKDVTIEWHRVGVDELPKDRMFRNAWRGDGGRWRLICRAQRLSRGTG